MLAYLPARRCARASARAPCALSSSVRLNWPIWAQWLAAHERFRLWGQEIAGWRAQFSQLTRDKQQLTAQSTRLATLRQKLATLPASPLTLSADDVAAAIEQQTQSRPLRQRLISLHEQHQLLRKRLRQNAESVQQAQASR
ncbi:exonuclease SbcC [Klebsiella pneumoniae]|uniref:Exonuclease SbcC n=1 Tax=Klebsiella pneumoniae TaxID=573 RepID=A0A378FS56_KLEPN|nr:exonuclease SbcC [Klebsiella pneumoniae]